MIKLNVSHIFTDRIDLIGIYFVLIGVVDKTKCSQLLTNANH